MTCATIWTLFTGLDFLAPIDVYTAGTNTVEDLSSATITASLISSNGETELIADYAQSSATTGAAWSTGRVVARFVAADTGAAAVISAIGPAYIGIKITKGLNTTALDLIGVTIKRGF